MPFFNIVAASNENTVVTEYEPVKSRSDSYQSGQVRKNPTLNCNVIKLSNLEHNPSLNSEKGAGFFLSFRPCQSSCIRHRTFQWLSRQP